MLRRDVLKLLSLSTLALGAGPLLAGCGTAPPPPTGATGVDLVSADVARVPGDEGAVAEVVGAMHVTGAALYGSLARGSSANLALSPYSITTALAMTANGAAGRTRTELELVFAGIDVETVNGGLNALTASVGSLAGEVVNSGGETDRLELASANALFGQRGFAWGEPFLDTLARDYGAGMNVVDWGGATEEARQEVNAWTAERTAGRIEEILPPGSVDPLTALVLVNALYLKAPWRTPFDKQATTEGPFTLLDGSATDVPMMTAGQPVGDAYATGEGWAAARLPYAGDGVAMTVLVPDAGRFVEVEQDVVERGLAGYLDALDPIGVVATLPSWTFRVHTSLMDPVRDLGITVPFGKGPERADFSPMTTDDALFIAAIEHEVFIAVDEDGTEAAAATAVVMAGESAAPAYAELLVDRPFLFVIHDVEHGTPLFVGRVLDPRGA